MYCIFYVMLLHVRHGETSGSFQQWLTLHVRHGEISGSFQQDADFPMILKRYPLYVRHREIPFYLSLTNLLIFIYYIMSHYYLFLTHKYFEENPKDTQSMISIVFNALVIEYSRKIEDMSLTLEETVILATKLAYKELSSMVNSTNELTLYYPLNDLVIKLIKYFEIQINVNIIRQTPVSHLRLFILYVELVLKLFSNFDFVESIIDLGLLYSNEVFSRLQRKLTSHEYPFDMNLVFDSVSWIKKGLSIDDINFYDSNVSLSTLSDNSNISLLFRNDVDLDKVAIHPGLFITGYKKYSSNNILTIADLISKPCYLQNKEFLNSVLTKYLEINFDYNILQQLRDFDIDIAGLKVGLTFFNLVQIACFTTVLQSAIKINAIQELASCFITKKCNKQVLRTIVNIIELTINVYSNEEMIIFYKTFTYQSLLFRTTFLSMLQDVSNILTTKFYKEIYTKISILLKLVYTKQTLGRLATSIKCLL